MAPLAKDTTIERFSAPREHAGGESLAIAALNEPRCRGLLEMYLAWRPRGSFHGLPPLRDDACRQWVQHLIRNGINLVALASERAVVGHTAIFPIDDRRCELLLAVAPPWQNQGIGTQLATQGVALARHLGFSRMWLLVEAINVRARRVYEKCGFEVLSCRQAREVEMVLDLSAFEIAAWRE